MCFPIIEYYAKGVFWDTGTCFIDIISAGWQH